MAGKTRIAREKWGQNIRRSQLRRLVLKAPVTYTRLCRRPLRYYVAGYSKKPFGKKIQALTDVSVCSQSDPPGKAGGLGTGRIFYFFVVFVVYFVWLGGVKLGCWPFSLSC